MSITSIALRSPFSNGLLSLFKEPVALAPMPCKCHQSTVEDHIEERYSDRSWSPTTTRPSSRASSTNSSFEIIDQALIETLVPSVALTRCDTAHAVARSLWGKIPPKNFGQVVPGVYRSAFPQAENFPFLKVLGLKSIITLVPEEYAESEHCFTNELGIQHFQVAIPPNKGGICIDKDAMASVLAVIMDPANHPLLIHCNKGKHRTGCVVACFRKCIDWELCRVVDEYRQYAGAKARGLDVEFIIGWEDPCLRQMAGALPRMPRFRRLMPVVVMPGFDTLSESPIRSGLISTRLRS